VLRRRGLPAAVQRQLGADAAQETAIGRTTVNLAH